MTLRTFKHLLLLATTAGILFTACKKDKDDLPAKPTVDVSEIGSGNSKIGYAGSDLHIDADVAAAGTIASVQVEIHSDVSGAWHFDSVYTEGFKGLKNANFHKHIDIPADAAVGSYHLHVIVEDEKGQETESEATLEIKIDPTLPAITGLEVAQEDGDLHVEGLINAPNKIAKVEVEVHGATWEKTFEYTDAAMVGKTSYTFHKHLDITAAPAGHYHVHVNVIDQAGKEREFEEHFDK